MKKLPVICKMLAKSKTGRTKQIKSIISNDFIINIFSVQTAFGASSLSEELKEMIAQRLNEINKDEAGRFAVRSSGVTEDSEETSAAGQNETFLGLKNNEEVFLAVIKCWASLYSFQSVHYRK